MLNKLKNLYIKFILNGHSRTVIAKKNVLYSITIKFLSMILVFTIMSLSIRYLGKEYYGLWVVLSGILVWTNLFDLGFTHGLRNSLAVALVKNEDAKLRDLVTVTYITMALISIVILTVLLPMAYYINWSDLFQVSSSLQTSEITIFIVIIIVSFNFQLFLKPITSILGAIQWTSIIPLISIIGTVMSFIGLIVLYNIETQNKMLVYIVLMSSAPILSLFLATIYLFTNKLRKFRPKIKKISFANIKEITNLGFKFFVIQFSGLIIFQTDNILISILYGTESVSDYNIVYRYFSIIVITVGVIMSPLWSAYTEAYEKKEFDWIKDTVKKLLYITLAISIITVFFVIFSESAYKLWIDESIEIPFSLSLGMGIFVIIYAFSNIFHYFINGTGHIRLQMYTNIIAAILNIPLSYLFSKILGFGLVGIIMATIISISITGVFAFIQFYKIINSSAKGIWIK